MSCNLHVIDSDHAITGSPIILNIDLFLSFLLGVDIMSFIKDVNVRMHIVTLSLGPGPGPGLLLHKAEIYLEDIYREHAQGFPPPPPPKGRFFSPPQKLQSV